MYIQYYIIILYAKSNTYSLWVFQYIIHLYYTLTILHILFHHFFHFISCNNSYQHSSPPSYKVIPSVMKKWQYKRRGQFSSCYSIFSFMCMFCRTFFCPFYFGHWAVCLSFDLQILITSCIFKLFLIVFYYLSASEI